MIFDVENIKEPQDKLIDKIKIFLNKISKPFSIFTFLVLLIYSLIINHDRNLFNLLYLAEYATGVLFSVLLLVEHFDKENLFIKNICLSKNNKKINCSSVLNSKDAYFIGLFSWSDIGFIYFTIVFLASLFLPTQLSLSFSVLTSFLIFPYVFYSLYYQKFIAKNWCILCLSVQGVITSVFVTSIFAYKITNFENLFILNNIILLLLFAMTVIALYVIVKPIIYSKINLPSVSKNFVTIKHNRDVKTILFNNQKTYSLNELEKISVGNTNGTDCITIIFNPICEPCILELTKLTPILKYKEDTRLEFLFLVDKNDDPLSYNIAKAMVSTYYNSKESFICMLEEYIENYPRSKYQFGNLKNANNSKIDLLILEHEKWCAKNKIFSTPQIFLNQKELPTFYTIEDLEYLVS